MVAALEDVDVQIHSSFHSFIKTLFIEHLLNVDTRCSTGDTTVNCRSRHASCSEIAYSPVEDRDQ